MHLPAYAVKAANIKPSNTIPAITPAMIRKRITGGASDLEGCDAGAGVDQANGVEDALGAGGWFHAD